MILEPSKACDFAKASYPFAAGRPRRNASGRWRPARRGRSNPFRPLGRGTLLFLALAGCFLFARASPPLDKVTLQLKWKHQFQFAGYYAALEKGYYRQAGLDVRLQEASTDADPSRTVLQGAAEFGIASSDLLLLRSRGEPVVALASIFQHSPLILLAQRSEKIGSIHDLAGKKVMIEPLATELLGYLEAEHVPARKMAMVPHTFSPEALLSGQVDAISAYSTDEPFLLKQAGVDYLTFNPRAGGIDFYGDTLYTTEAQLRNHPQRVRKFVEASLEGWRYAMDHPGEIVDVIFRKYSQRHSVEHLTFEAEQTRRLILPEVVEIGYMNPGRWQRIAEIYAEMGLAPPQMSLEGFLYDRNPQTNLAWLYYSLGGSLLVALLVAFTAVRFYRLNHRLRSEMSEREKAEEEVRNLELRYRTLAESAPFPVIITRKEDGVVLYANPCTAAKFAVDRNQVLGKPASGFYVDAKDRINLVEVLNRQGFAQNFEVQLCTADHQLFWADLSASVITFDHQEAIFIALIDITERKQLEMRLENMAMIDALTGLANRRFFTQRGAEEIARVRRHKLPMALLMLDIDHFKLINDTHGHEAGDAVLRQLALVLKQGLRESDLAGRLGGEEFGVLLPNTDAEGAINLAERLRQKLEKMVVAASNRVLRITVSIGVADYSAQRNTLDQILSQADAALYQAKNEGRNRVAGPLA